MTEQQFQLPPGMQFVPVTPEQAAHIQAYQEREQAFFEEFRTATVAWAPVTCSCRRRYRWNGRDRAAPQAKCTAHGGFWISADGRVI